MRGDYSQTAGPRYEQTKPMCLPGTWQVRTANGPQGPWFEKAKAIPFQCTNKKWPLLGNSCRMSSLEESRTILPSGMTHDGVRLFARIVRDPRAHHTDPDVYKKIRSHREHGFGGATYNLSRGLTPHRLRHPAERSGGSPNQNAGRDRKRTHAGDTRECWSARW